MKPQEVNGLYCLPCIEARPQLSATGAIQPYDTCTEKPCKGCGRKAEWWAVLTVRMAVQP